MMYTNVLNRGWLAARSALSGHRLSQYTAGRYPHTLPDWQRLGKSIVLTSSIYIADIASSFVFFAVGIYANTLPES